MLQTSYDLRIKSINSINTSNIFNFIASQINKEIIFKNYQIKIKFLKVLINKLFSYKIIIEYYKILYKKKFSSTILNILLFEVKLTFQLIKHEKKVDLIIFILGSNFLFTFNNVPCNIILQITNSSAHLMLPDSLWIINVQYVFASAPIFGHTSG